MTLYLLDAYAMIYRAYYAFIRTPRINSKGVNTSAIFGFTNTLLELLTKRQPDYIAVAFDSHGPTFRHEVFPEYKANRDAQPEDISIAVPYIKELLKAMNIPIVDYIWFFENEYLEFVNKYFNNIVFCVFFKIGIYDW